MTDTRECPECGAAAAGNFCSSCGTALGKRFCTQCGAKAGAGARFCTECGASFGGASAGGNLPRPAGGGSTPLITPQNTGWWIAGGMMMVVIVFMAWPILNPTSGTTQPGAQPAQQTAAPTDLSQMSPIEAADRLFNRVMSAASSGDTSQVATFLPMAIQAYDMARPLTTDGLFHLAQLQNEGLMYADALATAEEALAVNQNHLLNLHAAAEAAMGLGDDAKAQEYLGRILAVYDAEMASGNQDYQMHSRQMPDIRAFAQENIAG